MSDLEMQKVSVTAKNVNLSIDEDFGIDVTVENILFRKKTSESGKTIIEEETSPVKFFVDVVLSFFCDYEEGLYFTSQSEYHFLHDDIIYFNIIFYDESGYQIGDFSDIVEYVNTDFNPSFNLPYHRSLLSKEELKEELKPGVEGCYLKVNIVTSHKQADAIKDIFRQFEDKFHKVKFTVGRPVVEDE